MTRLRSVFRPAAGAALFLLVAAGMTACRRPELVLTQLAEARTLTADLMVQFSKAAAAADRAVLANTDDGSVSAANEARQARTALERDMGQLERLLHALGYSSEIGLLDAFSARYKDYKALDDSLLALAVENTNIKAERLAFGPQREAWEAFRTAVEATVRDVASAQSSKADAAAARAEAAVLEVQLLEARHIAEADESAMAALETQMTEKQADARARLKDLAALAGAGSARASLTAATAALDRFAAAQADIIRLSRQNTNIRSTALALGRKRSVAAGCEEILTQLADRLSHHEFGTR